MRNLLFILIVLCTLIRTNSFSQEMYFSPITSLNGSGAGYSIIPTNDGGYMGVGQLFQSLYNSYILLFKIDESGGLEWYNTIEGQGINVGYKIISTNDNNFLILARVAEAPSGFPSQPNTGSYFSKINSEGDVIWENTYSEEGATYLLDVCEGINNDFYYTGNNFGDGVINTNDGAWVVKTNSVGDTLWTKTLEDSIVAGFCIVPSFDDGCVVSGKDHFVYYDSVAGLSYQYPTPSFFKLNGNGDVIWQKYIDTTLNITVDAGKTIDNYNSIFVGRIAEYNSANKKAYVTRIDEFGDTVWTKTVEGISKFYSVSIYENENAFVCGGYFYDGTRHIPAIAKFDLDGNLIWKKIYTNLYEDNRIWGIHATNDEGAIAVGKYFNNNTNGVLILKTNSQGEYSSLGIDSFNQSVNILVYPNPVANYTTLDLSNVDYNSLNLVIYNYDGKKIKERDYQFEEKIQLDLSSIANGLYHMVITFDNQSSVSKKIVKQ